MSYKIGDILKVDNVTLHGIDMAIESMIGQKGIVIGISDYEGLRESGDCYKLLFNNGLIKKVLWRDISFIGTLKEIL